METTLFTSDGSASVKALGNPTRLRILDLLDKRPYTVSGLQQELGIPLASVSIQLSTLRAAGLVTTQKKGKEVHYFLSMPEVRQACHFIPGSLRSASVRLRQIRGNQKRQHTMCDAYTF